MALTVDSGAKATVGAICGGGGDIHIVNCGLGVRAEQGIGKICRSGVSGLDGLRLLAQNI